MHEVATDPDDGPRVHVSYYAGGFRVADVRRAAGLHRGRALHRTQDGNNFWGVEVHKHPNGQKYVLASDRDSGVWIFQYDGWNGLAD